MSLIQRHTLATCNDALNRLQRNQRTLSREVELCGIGYWSSREVRLRFCPAEPNTGIVFIREDIASRPEIPARIEYRQNAARRTVLRRGDATVEMVEHVVAALAGLRIDNCRVSVDAAEMPGFDGSSEPVVGALDEAGSVTQESVRPRLLIPRTLRVEEDGCWIEARPPASNTMTVEYRLDYGRHSPIPPQSVRVEVTPSLFRRELAASRTFLLASEATALRQQGLGSHVSHQDLLVFDENGPIENSLRWHDECARHKALDMVGDFALAGCDLSGHFVASRSGHRLNAMLVQTLLAECHSSEQRHTA
jgi:UDP-3-O-[3-hydroxymyristoyl] N-acetylglucosamine deacetylase